MPQTLSSASRRVLIIGVVIVAALSVGVGLQQRGGNEATASTGNVGRCLALKGDAARACYSREVGKQLAAAPRVDSAAVTFAADDSEGAGLLCDLHTRVGVTSQSRPSWVSWNEPSVS